MSQSVSYNTDSWCTYYADLACWALDWCTWDSDLSKWCRSVRNSLTCLSGDIKPISICSDLIDLFEWWLFWYWFDDLITFVEEGHPALITSRVIPFLNCLSLEVTSCWTRSTSPRQPPTPHNKNHDLGKLGSVQLSSSSDMSSMQSTLNIKSGRNDSLRKVGPIRLKNVVIKTFHVSVPCWSMVDVVVKAASQLHLNYLWISFQVWQPLVSSVLSVTANIGCTVGLLKSDFRKRHHSTSHVSL